MSHSSFRIRTRLALLLPVAAALIVAVPTGAATANQLPPGRPSLDQGTFTTGWIPFDHFRETLIIVQGTINGIPANILIDSGVSAVIVDSGFADRQRMPTSGRATVGGISGQAEARQLRNLTVKVRGLTLSDAGGIAVDLSPQQTASSAKVDVIVGRNIFDRFIVDIDFRQQVIAFHDAKRFRPPAGAVELRLSRLPNGLRTVPLALEGSPAVEATFDLGAGAPLTISSKLARDRLLLDGRPHSTVPSAGVEGIKVSKLVSAKARFAGLDMSDVPVRIEETWQNDVRGIDSPAFIGMGLLNRFRIISDYGRDRLWLIPYADAATRPFKKDRSGLYTVLSGDRLKVIHVGAGSPAAAAGWRNGDEILAVDGKPVIRDYYRSSLSDWPYRSAGTELSLTVADGSTRCLTLADYF